MAGDITKGYWLRMAKTVAVVKYLFAGSTSGTTTLQASAAASGVLTLPAATDTLVGQSTTDTLANKTISSATGLTFAEGANVILGSATGTKIGTSATLQKLGFFNATPVIQPTSASEAAVATTGAATGAVYGFTTAAQANGIVTLLNQLRADLVALGLIKGS